MSSSLLNDATDDIFSLFVEEKFGSESETGSSSKSVNSPERFDFHEIITSPSMIQEPENFNYNPGLFDIQPFVNYESSNETDSNDFPVRSSTRNTSANSLRVRKLPEPYSKRVTDHKKDLEDFLSQKPETFQSFDDEKAWKKKLKMLRNRLSAQASRDRIREQLDHVDKDNEDLRRSHLELEKKCQELAIENEHLRQENQFLRKQLMEPEHLQEDRLSTSAATSRSGSFGKKGVMLMAFLFAIGLFINFGLRQESLSLDLARASVGAVSHALVNLERHSRPQTPFDSTHFQHHSPSARQPKALLPSTESDQRLKYVSNVISESKTVPLSSQNGNSKHLRYPFLVSSELKKNLLSISSTGAERALIPFTNYFNDNPTGRYSVNKMDMVEGVIFTRNLENDEHSNRPNLGANSPADVYDDDEGQQTLTLLCPQVYPLFSPGRRQTHSNNKTLKQTPPTRIKILTPISISIEEKNRTVIKLSEISANTLVQTEVFMAFDSAFSTPSL